MKKGLDIRRIALTKVDNARHLQYHSSVYDLLVAFELTKLGIPEELKNDLEGSIHMEKDLSLEATANANSKLLHEKDVARSRLVLFIFSQVRSFLLSPEADEAEAAARLYVVTKRYTGIQLEPYDRETAHIDGLVEDLKKSDYTADMAKLRLTTPLTKLETLNKEFTTLSIQRTKERAAKKLPTAAKVRAETDAIFDRILMLLQSNYLYGAPPIEPKLIETLVGQINQRTDEVDAAYKHGLSMKKNAAERKKDPNKPKDPKDPKDQKPKKPKKDTDEPDIHLPEEEDPKKPEGPKTPEGGGSGSGGGSGTPSGGGSAVGGGTSPKQPESGGSGDDAPEIHMPEE